MSEQAVTSPGESLQKRIADLRESPAWANYELVRQRVLALMADPGMREGVANPSEYWREELAGFEYMLDASPLIVDKLRHHCYHVTGLRVYDYRTNKDAGQLEEKLRALVEIGGEELLVPESPQLGGFGFEVDGRLFNVDTLKFYEAMIALDRGEVLTTLRESAQRPVVMEIGAGWGGFAYTVKNVLPESTYVIVDFPELFLFSATYLTTLFPDATAVFYGDDNFDEAIRGETAADFIFIPHTAYADVRPARLDLTVNMVSFQEMTTAQVEDYVRYAYELGCPFLYSLNRDRSRYNTELSSVREIIDRWYWRHEIPLLPVSYAKMLNKAPKGKTGKAKEKLKTTLKAAGAGADDYRHVVGWRRIEPGGPPAATPTSAS